MKKDSFPSFGQKRVTPSEAATGIIPFTMKEENP